jgi:hypothetical protein
MKSENISSNFSPRLLIAVFILTLALLLGACSGSDANPDGTVALTIIVRAASEAPEGYGVEPGDEIEGASVAVANVETPEVEPPFAATDESGRVEFMVKSGTYNIYAKAETHDPYCWWSGSAEVKITNKRAKVVIDDAWVVCSHPGG